jgi:predicted acylesterase/phospholipase RssA
VTRSSAALDLLRSAQRIGFVLSGGSARCAFQIGALETLAELGIRPSLCVGVSAGVWGAAATAAGTGHRIRHYWRSFVRMPHLDLGNLVRERSPYRFNEIHRRNFRRYIGAERLLAPEALPLLVGVTRLRDRQPWVFKVSEFEDPLIPLLATNYLPPFFTHAPRIGGLRYGDGGMTDNIPYLPAFESGCDVVVLLANKGESEGGLYRNPREIEHVIPEPYRSRTVVIRPRHRLPVSFTERRWEALLPIIELGGLRAREVLLGESHPETEARALGRAPTVLVARLLRRAISRPSPEI